MSEIDRELTKLKPFGQWLPERKIPERQDGDQKNLGNRAFILQNREIGS